MVDLIRKNFFEGDCVVSSLSYACLERVKACDPMIHTAFITNVAAGRVEELAARIEVLPVDENGNYTETPWKGHFIMEDGLDVEIIKYLGEGNKVYAKQKIEHNYPHCWRCGTPLVYYAKPSWYIEMSVFTCSC